MKYYWLLFFSLFYFLSVHLRVVRGATVGRGNVINIVDACVSAYLCFVFWTFIKMVSRVMRTVCSYIMQLVFIRGSEPNSCLMPNTGKKQWNAAFPRKGTAARCRVEEGLVHVRT